MTDQQAYANLERRIQELEEYQKREATISILSLINKINDLHDLITEVSWLLQSWSGCEAVGIRMKENGHFPYLHTSGFSANHIQTENNLCTAAPHGGQIWDSTTDNPLLEGMCGKVLSRRFNPQLPFFTEYGSFCTNSTSELQNSAGHAANDAQSCTKCHSQGYESVALIPLKSGSEVFGLLQLNDSRTNMFSSQILTLLEKLAFNLSISLEKKSATQKLRKTKEELAAIYDNAPIIMIVLDTNYRVVKHNQYTNEFFNSTNEDLRGQILAEVINCPYYYNSSQNCCTNTHFDQCTIGNIICYAFEHGKSYRHIEARINLYNENKIESYVFLLSCSLIRGDQETQALITMLDITERKNFEEKLNYMSFHDTLTGLYNRNFFQEEMNRLQDGRYDPISIIICDLDGFKFINDTLGHQSGDELLANTGELLRQNFRFSDIVARIGGDEFAILAPSTDTEKAEQLAQRLRRAVQEYNEKDPRVPISLSIGYATEQSRNPDMRKLFREADDVMYREKMQREESTRNSTVKTLMRALEARDFITEGHSERLQKLVHSLARYMNLSESMINDMLLLVQFHDLGKVGIPDHILFKPGSLTEKEMEEMRNHSEIGQRIAQAMPHLDPIAKWILQHHERWDGKGYPRGLQGEEIPLACRILAIADAYDAMISDRPYRKAMSHEEAIEELCRCAGTQFDPELVERFIEIVDKSNSKSN